MNTVLETQELVKIYKSSTQAVKAVNQVSIALHQGEFVALVGPSGSGKTTMLALIAGLLVPTSGKIIIDGAIVSELNEMERTKFRREKIGFTFQTNNLVPYLTAQENVELMLRINNKLDREGSNRAKELLSRLGLEERLDSLPTQLSGGEQQRVAIARSLIHEPTLVLADEPTANLDTERAYQVVRLFAELIHEQKRTGIMVTHDLRMCQEVDRIFEICDGNICNIIEEREGIEALAEFGRKLTKEDRKILEKNNLPSGLNIQQLNGSTALVIE